METEKFRNTKEEEKWNLIFRSKASLDKYRALLDRTKKVSRLLSD